MPRYITAIFFLLLFSVQMMNKAVIVLDYYANTALFAKDCENKAKPQLQCKGKCQMTKKLAAEERKDQQASGGKSECKNEVISSRSFFATLPVASGGDRAPFQPYFSRNYPEALAADIFHPPSLV